MSVQQILNGRLLWAACLVAVVAAGCRTYGGYGSEEATLEQIVAANERFAQSLAEAWTALMTLDGAAAEPEARLLAERYRLLVQAHEALLEEHRALAERAADHPGRYRFLNRTLGSILSEQRMIEERYVTLLQMAERPPDTTAVVPTEMRSASRYYVAPPYYQRLIGAMRRPGIVAASEERDPQAGAAPEQEPSAQEAPPAGTAPPGAQGEAEQQVEN